MSTKQKIIYDIMDHKQLRYYGYNILKKNVELSANIKRNKMTAIYIISTKSRAKKKYYKVGSHTGTIKKLKSRYSTPLINEKVYYFHPHSKAKDIEKQFKKKLFDSRIVNKRGHRTEWVKLELSIIINHIRQIIIDLGFESK